MRVGMKIALGFSVVIVIMLAMGGTSFYSAGNIATQMEVITHNNQRIDLVNAVDKTFTEGVVAIRGYMVYGKPDYAKQFADKMDAAIKNATDLLQVARPEKKADVEKLILNIKQYKNDVQAKVLPVVEQEKSMKSSGIMNAATLAAIEEQYTQIGLTLVPVAEAINKTTSGLVVDNRKAINDQLVASTATVGTVKTTTIVLSLISLILVIVVSFFLTRMVTKPLATVNARLDEMAQGHFDKDIDVRYIKRPDEFGDMGRSFDKMLKSMRQLIGHVSQSAEQLAASSEELTASAEQSAQASNQVAMSVTEMAHGSEKQVAAVNDTSAIVEEISATMEEVAATAQEMAGKANATSKATVDGQSAVDQAIDQMKNIGQGAQQAQRAAGDLEAGSRQIEAIVGLISSIAGQTNLLALNAAIEAARAGEQGRGFAVVAEEVRKLAEQSEKAARQIKELIGTNDNNIKNVVGVVSNTLQEIDQGVALVGKAGAGFREIRSLVETVTQQVGEISKALGEIAIGSQQIVGSMKAVENVSRDAAAEAQNVSAATEEQSASTEEIASASQALAKLATELQAAMGKFRI
ncbi:MAG TPA: methyl-accepting chemotaxis protein [Negativicutes bacterium]|nr:methyl-accepting chemotaxis protein [Negativicutes bacterium]